MNAPKEAVDTSNPPFRMYRVAWRYRKGGETQYGAWFPSKSRTQAAVDIGNTENPEVEHWVEES